MNKDFLNNKIACPVDGVRRRNDYQRPDFQEFFAGNLKARQVMVSDKESVRIWNAKIKEFEQQVQRCRNIIRPLLEIMMRSPEEVVGIYYCSVSILKGKIQEFNLEIKKFERLKSYAKMDDKRRLDVERARAVPISSFHIAEWRKQSSGRSTICCPLHGEKTPSFVWFQQENRYHCFGCQAHGDSIDLFMKLHSCDFKTAVRELSKY